MSAICEHIFEKRDPNKPRYSLTEFDLKASLGLSIRKNIASGLFEIFTIWTDIVMFRGTFDEVITEANRLENNKFGKIKVKCNDNCKIQTELETM